MSDSIIQKAIEMFEGKEKKTSGRFESYIKNFPGKFPSAEKTTDIARKKKMGEEASVRFEWEQIARRIKFRNFSDEPIDESTKQSILAGLKAIGSGVCLDASKKLEEVKPVTWKEKDVKLGKLRPRNKKGNGYDDND